MKSLPLHLSAEIRNSKNFPSFNINCNLVVRAIEHRHINPIACTRPKKFK